MTAPRVTLCIFAKPPVPGRVKTRLAATIGAEAAAALAEAFLRDGEAAARALPWAEPVVATTGALAKGLTGLPVWDQGPGDLGDRMERALLRGISRTGASMVVGTDSPGLPRAWLDGARATLDTHDAVLGPADDGGFWLIGLRRCPPGLLAGLPWSSAETLDATAARLAAWGLSVGWAPRWFDVDRVDDLERLAALIAAGTVEAPHTRGALAALGRLP